MYVYVFVCTLCTPFHTVATTSLRIHYDIETSITGVRPSTGVMNNTMLIVTVGTLLPGFPTFCGLDALVGAGVVGITPANVTGASNATCTLGARPSNSNYTYVLRFSLDDGVTWTTENDVRITYVGCGNNIVDDGEECDGLADSCCNATSCTTIAGCATSSGFTPTGARNDGVYTYTYIHIYVHYV